MTTSSLVPRRAQRRLAWSALLASVVAVAALTAGTLTASAAMAATAKPSIAIKDFEFKPTPLRVKAGVKIKIANRDDTTHTLTADKGAFHTGDIVFFGEDGIDHGEEARHLQIPLRDPQLHEGHRQSVVSEIGDAQVADADERRDTTQLGRDAVRHPTRHAEHVVVLATGCSGSSRA